MDEGRPPAVRRWVSGPLEARWTTQGAFDELVVTDPQGRCIVHLERLDSGHWWLAGYDADNGTTFHVDLTSGMPIEAIGEEQSP